MGIMLTFKIVQAAIIVHTFLCLGIRAVGCGCSVGQPNPCSAHSSCHDLCFLFLEALSILQLTWHLTSPEPPLWTQWPR